MGKAMGVKLVFFEGRFIFRRREVFEFREIFACSRVRAAENPVMIKKKEKQTYD
jgi:hypothetical protein